MSQPIQERRLCNLIGNSSSQKRNPDADDTWTVWHHWGSGLHRGSVLRSVCRHTRVRLARRQVFGRRTIFTYSLLWYTAANVIMAFQTTAFDLNLWRFIAGIG